MRMIIRMTVVAAVCLAAATTIFAQQHRNHPAAVQIGGVYGGFTANSQSGDLDGMRVAIFAAGGAWRAIVQIAQGGAEDPAPHFVDVTVNGKKVDFSVDGTAYSGTISAAGLKLKDQGLLKRKTAASFFAYAP